jgi:hypothetical protein
MHKKQLLTHERLPSREPYDGPNQGWNDSFDSNRLLIVHYMVNYLLFNKLINWKKND